MKKIITLIIIISILTGVYILSKKQKLNISTESKSIKTVPKFTEIEIPFVRKYSKDTVQVSGGSLIDINNDGVDEVFICGGKDQEDGLIFFENNKFVNKISSIGLFNLINCYGSFVVDINEDNFSDILIAKEDGVYKYLNNKNGKFTSTKIDIKFEENTVPVNISGGDIDNDGILDLYISTFTKASILKNGQFNNDEHARENVLLGGKKDGTFEDITKESEAYYDENTFIASLVDLDDDQLSDIVIAPDTSRMVIFKNLGNKNFTKLDPISDNGFWMGLALADMDNDGDIDIFSTNVGSTISERFLRGDLKQEESLSSKWVLLRNDGDFKFTDITKDSKLDNYEFAWGAIFEDFNLDGILDLNVTQNYIKWPLHKVSKLSGKLLLGSKSGEYENTTKESEVENFAYGMTPLVSDFNKDGYPDLINLNLDGQAKAFINNGGESKSFTVEIPTETKYIDAKIYTTLKDKTKIYRQYVPSQGLSSSQSNKIIVPLLENNTALKVEIKLNNGEIKIYENVKSGDFLRVK